jgi:hypothetical protein
MIPTTDLADLLFVAFCACVLIATLLILDDIFTD